MIRSGPMRLVSGSFWQASGGAVSSPIRRGCTECPAHRQGEVHGSSPRLYQGQWGMRLCHSGMPLVVCVLSGGRACTECPASRPVRVAWFWSTCGLGQWGMRPVPSRHASGGPLTFRWGVGVRSVLHIARESTRGSSPWSDSANGAMRLCHSGMPQEGAISSLLGVVVRRVLQIAQESFGVKSQFHFVRAHRLAVRLRVRARCGLKFRQKHGDSVPNPKGGGTGVHCWEANQKSNKPGRSCLLFLGVLRCGAFACSVVGALLFLVVDPGFAPRSEKVCKKDRVQGQKWTHDTNVCRKAKTWIPSPFLPKALSFFKRPPQPPTFHPKVFATPQRIIVSQTTHAVRSEGGTWQITLVYRYSSQCDFALAAFRNFVCYLGRMGWL